jgi:hypothetical protein
MGMAQPQTGRSSARLSDEELEYYGDLYVRCGIREFGVDFEGFLNNPEYYLQKYARGRWRGEGGDGQDRRRGLLGYLGLRQTTPTAKD